MRKLIMSLMIVLLLCSTTLSVFAAPGGIESGTISLTITPNSEVTAYRVGDIQEKDDGYIFVLTGDYAASEQENILSSEQAAELAKIAKNDTNGETKVADENGAVSFEVEAGLYLLVQTKAGEGNKVFNPFLISMPNCEDGTYTDQVDATPKISTDTPDTPTTPGKPNYPSGGGSSGGGRLPQTGQLNWPVPLLAVSGLALFILGWALRKGTYEA